jgi:cytochrome c5
MAVFRVGGGACRTRLAGASGPGSQQGPPRIFCIAFSHETGENLMKKLTLAATALAVAAALAGCGRNDDSATTASTSSAPSTTAPSSSDSSTTATAPSSTETGSANMASAPSASPSTDSSGSVASSSSGSGMSSTDASASTTAAMGAGGGGQTVYTSTCAMCHAAGVSGAPKPGDKEDWKPRIAQGKDTLYQHAITGFQGKKGMMPPKGGNTSIADADVKAAVDFMVDQSK